MHSAFQETMCLVKHFFRRLTVRLNIITALFQLSHKFQAVFSACTKIIQLAGLLLLLLFFKPTSTKPQAEKTRLDILNYGCNGNLLCYNSVVERNRISSLQSHGKALEITIIIIIITILYYAIYGSTQAHKHEQLTAKIHQNYI